MSELYTDRLKDKVIYRGAPFQKLTNITSILYLPVVVFEPRPPVGGPQQGLQGAGQVHEPVAHQEEHTEHTTQSGEVYEHTEHTTQSGENQMTAQKVYIRTITGKSKMARGGTGLIIKIDFFFFFQ